VNLEARWAKGSLGFNARSSTWEKSPPGPLLPRRGEREFIVREPGQWLEASGRSRLFKYGLTV